MTNLEKVIMCGNIMRQLDGAKEPSGFEATLATVYYYAKFKQGNESAFAHMVMFAARGYWFIWLWVESQYGEEAVKAAVDMVRLFAQFNPAHKATFDKYLEYRKGQCCNCGQYGLLHDPCEHCREFSYQ